MYRPGRIFPWLILPTFLVWSMGQIFRDGSWLTGLCFYFPSPLAALTLLAIAFLAWRRSAGRIALLAGLLALGPAIFVVVVENQWSARSHGNSAAELSLVHWNVYGQGNSWSAILDPLKKLDADLYVLSEVPAGEPVLAELGSGYASLRRGNLAILARGRVAPRSRPVSTGPIKVMHVSCTIPGNEISVLAVDLPSSLAVKRDPLLSQVCEWIEQYQPDVIVGDFNAPRRSWALSNLPDGYEHAYWQAGAGWSYTWPVPVPLWAIDQCIVGPRLAIIGYELRSSHISDHRLQRLRCIRKKSD